MFRPDKKIVLGSGSPRRKMLLKEFGIDFRTLISDTKEIPPPHLSRGNVASFLAEEKADVLIKKIDENELLITADTIVCLGPKLLGKPVDTEDAIRMLTILNGRNHQVYTGICLLDHKKEKTFCIESNVFFRQLNENEIREYVSIYRPFDKAGAYGAQETLGENQDPLSEKEKIFLTKHNNEDLLDKTRSTDSGKRIRIIDHIEGSYFNVMGLPIVELFEELELFYN